MNDKVNGSLVIRKIDILINNLDNNWKDINEKEANKLKEAWNDPNCEDFIDKFDIVDSKIKDIIYKLTFIKDCWEKYLISSDAKNTNKGETNNE